MGTARKTQILRGTGKLLQGTSREVRMAKKTGYWVRRQLGGIGRYEDGATGKWGGTDRRNEYEGNTRNGRLTDCLYHHHKKVP